MGVSNREGGVCRPKDLLHVDGSGLMPEQFARAFTEERLLRLFSAKLHPFQPESYDRIVLVADPWLTESLGLSRTSDGIGRMRPLANA